MSVLEVRDIHMQRDGVSVLSGASLMVKPSELLAVVGPNGAGKSTLLSIMAGLLKPTSGAVLLDDQPLAAMPAEARARALAYLPQASDIAWPIPVRDIIALGRSPHRRTRGLAQTAADIDAVARAAESVGVSALLDRQATSLSGGERRRVELARALAVEAPILLADEPTAGLDPGMGLEAMETLQTSARAKTVVAVTHDLGLAAQFAGRVVVIAEGILAADGPPLEALRPDVLASAYGVRPMPSCAGLPSGWEWADAAGRP